MFVLVACECVWFAASPAAELQFVCVVPQSAICGLGWFLLIIAMATITGCHSALVSELLAAIPRSVQLLPRLVGISIVAI